MDVEEPRGTVESWENKIRSFLTQRKEQGRKGIPPAFRKERSRTRGTYAGYGGNLHWMEEVSIAVFPVFTHIAPH